MTLVVGHDDAMLSASYHSVNRADVAAVVVESIIERANGLRLDLCAHPGKFSLAPTPGSPDRTRPPLPY